MYTIMLNVFETQGTSSRPDLVNGMMYEYDEALALWYPVLDQAEVMLRLLETFDDIKIGTQDIVLENAQVVERWLRAQDAAAEKVLIASEYRRAKNVGPVHPFSFGDVEDGRIHGCVRRFDIKFYSENDFSVEIQAKVRRFLQGFGMGEIEEYEF